MTAKARRPKRPKFPKEPTPQRITLAKAVEYTQRYRKAAPASEHAGFFFLDNLKQLLDQPGVFGMRIYHGLDADCKYRMVLVGVDRDGNDIVKAPTQRTMAARASGDAVMLDIHLPCPPICPHNSPLN